MSMFLKRIPIRNFILFGVKEELILAKNLLKIYNKDNVINLVGRTTFPDLAAIINKMDLFISNDTGPMHLAALTGVPTVAIFGPTNERKWSPPGRFRAVTSNCTCRPCYYLSSMPECKDFACLNKITPEMVFQAVKEVLENR